MDLCRPLQWQSVKDTAIDLSLVDPREPVPEAQGTQPAKMSARPARPKDALRDACSLVDCSWVSSPLCLGVSFVQCWRMWLDCQSQSQMRNQTEDSVSWVLGRNLGAFAVGGWTMLDVAACTAPPACPTVGWLCATLWTVRHSQTRPREESREAGGLKDVVFNDPARAQCLHLHLLFQHFRRPNSWEVLLREHVTRCWMMASRLQGEVCGLPYSRSYSVLDVAEEGWGVFSSTPLTREYDARPWPHKGHFNGLKLEDVRIYGSLLHSPTSYSIKFARESILCTQIPSEEALGVLMLTYDW